MSPGWHRSTDPIYCLSRCVWLGLCAMWLVSQGFSQDLEKFWRQTFIFVCVFVFCDILFFVFFRAKQRSSSEVNGAQFDLSGKLWRFTSKPVESGYASASLDVWKKCTRRKSKHLSIYNTHICWSLVERTHTNTGRACRLHTERPGIKLKIFSLRGEKKREELFLCQATKCTSTKTYEPHTQ